MNIINITFWDVTSRVLFVPVRPSPSMISWQRKRKRNNPVVHLVVFVTPVPPPNQNTPNPRIGSKMELSQKLRIKDDVDPAGHFPRLELLKVLEPSNTISLKVCPNNNWSIVIPPVITVVREDLWTMPLLMMKIPR